MQQNPQKKPRDKALQRALRFAVLFQEDTFDQILFDLNSMPLNATEYPTGFSAACDNAGIQSEEKAWLWNYLKHMKDKNTQGKEFWEDPPEAWATTGW